MLLSYAYYAKDDLAKHRAKMPCGRLLVDSGAFTAKTVGQKITLADYASFLGRWRGVYDHAVTLDVIGDPVATRRNTHALHSQGHNVMPVFTRGGTTADFDAMVRDSGYVCVGGGVGMPLKVLVPRLRGLQRRAEELGGGIHALGVGSLTALRAIRPYSADASNVTSVFRFGTVICYDGRQIRQFAMTDAKRMRANLHHLRAQGLDMATHVQTGRQPTGKGPRGAFMHGMSMSYVCADEDTTRYAVPVPTGVKDTPGTHMYSAVVGGFLAPALAELDQLLHTGAWSPPIWANRYRARHLTQCRAEARADELKESAHV